MKTSFTGALSIVVATLCAACGQDVDLIYADSSFMVGFVVPERPQVGRHAWVCAADDQAKTVNDDSPSVIDGTWSGQMEDYAFLSGSRQITLALAHQSSGAVFGKVTLGNAPKCEPTQCFPDNELGYPAGVHFAVDAKDAPPPSPPYDGFTYTALGGTFDGSELTVGIDPREFWGDWCEQQPRVYNTRFGYACSFETPLPIRTVASDGDPWCFYGGLHDTCDKVALCVVQTTFEPVVSGVCDCTTAGCSVCLPPGISPVAFHLQLSGDTLTGTVEAIDTKSMRHLAATIGGKKLTLARVSQ